MVQVSAVNFSLILQLANHRSTLGFLRWYANILANFGIILDPTKHNLSVGMLYHFSHQTQGKKWGCTMTSFMSFPPFSIGLV